MGWLVFDIIAAPYMTRQPPALQEKITVLERGSDMASPPIARR